MIGTLLVLARTLHLGSAMLLVALPFFVLVILRPRSTAKKGEGYLVFFRGFIKGLWLALMVEFISGVLWFWLAAAQMSDRSPWSLPDARDLHAALWQTQFGQIWLWRGGIGVLLALALSFISRVDSLTYPGILSRIGLVLGMSGLLLITLAWAGHAVAGIHYHPLHLAVDVLHLFLGSIWPIGLLPLGWFLWSLKITNHLSAGNAEIGTLQRFSQCSLVVVLLLFFTGFVNGWLMIGSWNALLITTYGQLLLAKVLIAMTMIGLGTYHRLYLLPRIQEGHRYLRILRRTVLVESFLAMVVLLIVGIMGTTPPPS